jgi:two-component system, chemotaxis family, chemotaxis protein CheY
MQARRPLRFLIVEHVGAMRALIRDLLKDLGHADVDQADNATAAWQKLREAPFDFVVADLDMPEAGTLALLRQIRGDATLARLPVLLVAEAATRETIVAAGEAGASACLVKPFTPAAFQARIDRIVDRATASA